MGTFTVKVEFGTPDRNRFEIRLWLIPAPSFLASGCAPAARAQTRAETKLLDG
jgi:hypothetical protein